MHKQLTAALIMSLLVPISSSDPDGDGVGGFGVIAGTDGKTLTATATQQHDGTDATRDGSTDQISDSAPLPRCRAIIDNRCVGYPFERETEETPGTPAITITDLASFSPESVTLTAEPDNVGIADMPANFLAEATTHTRTGTLFGQPLTVRFTPAGYDYTYGDGTTATLTTPGRSWDDLGQAQFTPTPTSHIYADRGTYLADVDVRYTAEIDFGSGWFPIDGELTTDGPAQEIRIFEAHTALVAYTCAEKPTAPGC